MLRFLAWAFPCVADLHHEGVLLERDRDEWEAVALDRLDQIFALKDDLTATRRARDELSVLAAEAKSSAAKSRELHEAASTRAVAAERDAAYYRGIVGNVRRAMQHDHRAVVEASEARVHPEQRDSNGPNTAWDSVSLAKAGLYQYPPAHGAGALDGKPVLIGVDGDRREVELACQQQKAAAARANLR